MFDKEFFKFTMMFLGMLILSWVGFIAIKEYAISSGQGLPNSASVGELGK